MAGLLARFLQTATSHSASTSRFAYASYLTHAQQIPGSWLSTYSTRAGGTESSESGSKDDAAGTSSSGDESSEAFPANVEELQSMLREKDEVVAQLSSEVNKITDAFKRNLAEMENLRQRTAKEVDSAKKFAVQGFVKDLLDVGDNLERAVSSIPADALAGKDVDPAQMQIMLKSVVSGIQSTEKIFLQVLNRQGVERYDALNEKFDPNFHSALFEVPDGSKEPGTVGVVTKRGYRMHGRVVRPAEVGVVRAP